jgi:hypothetical protein
MTLSNIITTELMRWIQPDTCIPNYYIGRWECDILRITKSSHLVEYEVKVSRADFKADASKECRWQSKYDNIKAGGRVNRFFYVVPEGIIHKDEVPDWAGLIYAIKIKGHNQVVFNTVKMAKMLSRFPMAPTSYKKIANNLSLKLFNTRTKLLK